MKITFKNKNLLFILGVFAILIAIPLTTILTIRGDEVTREQRAATTWAFEETFEGCVPSSVTTCPLPTDRFEFLSTHRAKGFEDTATLESGMDLNGGSLGQGQFHAQHTSTCGPPPGTHIVQARQDNDTQNPEPSFFMCGGPGNGHLMSSAGSTSGYTVTNFWPRQEFDFSDGSGVIEFDASFYPEGGRAWFEILISPKEELQIAAAKEGFPIDEKYPKNRLVFATFTGSERHMEAGKGALQPGGVIGSANEGRWGLEHPGDSALTNQMIRRKNIIEINGNIVTWKTQTADPAVFDSLSMTLSQPLGFSKGLVFFKTHSYTPDKALNYDKLTTHWDNIRFDGPVLTPYESVFARPGLPDPVRGVGRVVTQTVTLTRIGANPALAGQLNFATDNAYDLSINGNPPIKINLHTPEQTENGCGHRNFGTFRTNINPAHLRVGSNTLTWTVVGGCDWNSTLKNILGLKAVHIQMDSSTSGGSTPPPPTSKPGDVNSDNNVNSSDLALIVSRWGTADTQADLNKSGKVDSADLALVIANWGR